MTQKKVRWLIVPLITLCLSGLQAQTFLNIKEKSGIQTSFALNDLNKLVFTSGKMTVSPKTDNNTDFPILTVRYLNFTNTTSISEIKSIGNNGLKLYPNPVLDVLQIEYKAANIENVLVQILDIQGKVLYQNNLPNQSGINSIFIPVESFRDGLYLCRLKHGDNLEISRFIKL